MRNNDRRKNDNDKKNDRPFGRDSQKQRSFEKGGREFDKRGPRRDFEGRDRFEKRDRFEDQDRYEKRDRFEERDGEFVSADIREGRNPVLEALRVGAGVNKVLLAEGVKGDAIFEILSLCKEKGVPYERVPRARLDALSETGNHQGVIAYAAAAGYVEVEDILKVAEEAGEAPFIIALDGVQDPYNLGSILRTANAVGAHGVITTKRRSVALTAQVAKASAGAVEYVKVARVPNLTQTLKELKKQGLWVYGAHMTGRPMTGQKLKGPIVLVVGSEGEGISRLVLENCDGLVSIPMKEGGVTSLSASVAAAVLMYEIRRQRG